MNFERVAWLFLLAGVPIVVWLRRAVSMSAVRGVVVFAGTRARSCGSATDSPLRLAIVWTLLVLAAAGPLVGVAPREVERTGFDVIVALDASRSMWVEDIGESRLERARREISRLLAATPGGRFGLVAFAGQAERVCPLTEDRTGFLARLADVSPELRTAGGSSIGDALDCALDSFEAPSGRERFIVLVTDGETRESSAELSAAVARARRADVVVHSITVGTERGGPIPEGGGESDRFIVGDDGSPVISRASSLPGRTACEATGGRAIDARDSAGALEDLAAALAGSGVGSGARIERMLPCDRYAILTVVALSFLLPIGWWRVRSARSPGRPVNAWSVALVAIPLLGSAAVDAWRAAVAKHEAGDFAAAIALYREARASASDPRLAERIDFDLALALLRDAQLPLAHAEFERLASVASGTLEGRARFGASLALVRAAQAAHGQPHEAGLLQRAKAGFVGALRAGEGDAAAANLEWVTRRLAELGGENEPRPESGGSSGDERNSAGNDAPGAAPDGSAESGPGSDAGSAGEAGAVGGDERSASPPGADEGSAGEPSQNPPPDPPSAQRLRFEEIERIVAEFELRRIAYDAARARKARGVSPFDW